MAGRIEASRIAAALVRERPTAAAERSLGRIVPRTVTQIVNKSGKTVVCDL